MPGPQNEKDFLGIKTRPLLSALNAFKVLKAVSALVLFVRKVIDLSRLKSIPYGPIKQGYLRIRAVICRSVFMATGLFSAH